LSEDDWTNCGLDLLDRFERILKEINGILNRINSLDIEFKQLVLNDWRGKKEKYYPIWMYKNLCIAVFQNFGLQHLDEKKFCDKYHSQWLKELPRYDDFEFDLLATSQIERDLIATIKTKALPIPVSGKDVMSHFGIAPGTTVKRLMSDAYDIFHTLPCSKEELLSKLTL
jgi:hypothetical protein